MAAITEAGYDANYSWDNFKLLLMFLSCVFAMVAQFYPMPFPDSRILLAVCCALYFIISTVLQAVVVFIDKDTIMFLKAKNGVVDHEMRIRTNFPRFQEYFMLIIQGKDESSPCTTGKMYVGKYFTSKGEFDEVRYFFIKHNYFIKNNILIILFALYCRKDFFKMLKDTWINIFLKVILRLNIIIKLIKLLIGRYYL
jgi:signal peptidase complex subunit 2